MSRKLIRPNFESKCPQCGKVTLTFKEYDDYPCWECYVKKQQEKNVMPGSLDEEDDWEYQGRWDTF